MANGIKYQAHEILNKVLNTAETGLQVDIVSGAEYAEDDEHSSGDTGTFVLGVRNDVLATLGGADGDYSPLQVNASGALYVEIASGGSADAAHVDDAGFTLGTHSGMMMMGFAGTQSVDANDAGAIAMETDGSIHIHDGGNTITVDGTVTANLSATDNAVLDAMVVDLDAIETLLTAANVDHAANEVLLTGIDADTNAIKVDMAAVEVLLTAANVDHAANEVLLTGIDADTNAIKVDMAAIEVLLTAANVDHAANEVLLGTIDSDTNDIKTATEASNTHLGNMFYDTALAVTPSDGSDLSGEPFYAVYVGTGGNLKVDMADGGSAVTLSNVASGQLLPIMVERIYDTGTTASNIIAFK